MIQDSGTRPGLEALHRYPYMQIQLEDRPERRRNRIDRRGQLEEPVLDGLICQVAEAGAKLVTVSGARYAVHEALLTLGGIDAVDDVFLAPPGALAAAGGTGVWTCWGCEGVDRSGSGAGVGGAPGRTVLEMLAAVYPSCEATSRAGHVQGGRTKPFPAPVQARLERCGIKSVLLVPILEESHYKGLLGLVSGTSRIPWSVSDEIALKALSSGIGSRLRDIPGWASHQAVNPEHLPSEFQLIARALSGATEGVLLFDAAGRVLFVNQQGAEMLEAAPNDVPGLGTVADVTGRFVEEDRPRIEAALRGTDTVHLDATRTLSPGETRRFNLRIDGVVDEKQQPLGRLCTLRELPGESEQNGRLFLDAQILSQVHDAILAVDRKGTVVFFNQGAEKIYGVAREEALGRPLRRLTRTRKVAFEDDPVILKAVRAQGVWTGRDRLVLKDWRPRQVTISLTPLMIDGAQVGLIAVVRDIFLEEAVNRQQEVRIEHRIRVESALVEASQMLVSGGDVDFEPLLGLIGEAVGAETVYFVETPPDSQLLQNISLHAQSDRSDLEAVGPVLNSVSDGMPDGLPEDQHQIHRWHARRLTRTHTADAYPPLAVPVLSPQGKLHGYLGVEYGGRPPEWGEADSRVLGVLGDLLSTYFERKISEKALLESEERYRTFVDTTTEAIWRFELEDGVPCSIDPNEQVQALRDRAILAECNRVMSALLGFDDPDRLVGRRLGSVLPNLEHILMVGFIQSGYRLRNYEYSVECQEGVRRHFVVNAVGILDAGRLVRIWGGCVEVTERVELEQRMVEALEEQQQRIGRDLHDGVGQLLTGVRMLSQNLAERLESERADYAPQSRKIAGFAEEASQRVREIYRGLTPSQLFHEGLVTALQELAHNTNALPGVTCSFVGDGRVDVWERDTKMHLYRIAQEATNNALKHARASEILISLKIIDKALVLQVEDNGVGFDTNHRSGKSLGLSSMTYRARTIGGDLDIHSEAGAGTVVHCVLRENFSTGLTAA